MSASFNRVILVGNLTRDPEFRNIPSTGTAVADIGLAVNDRRKSPTGEWVEETTFVDITFWGRQAEVVSEWCSKGSPLLVEGRLKLDTWEDKNDGQKRSKLKVIGEKIQLLGTGGSKGGGVTGTSRPSAQAAQSYDDMMPPPNDPEDIPF